MRPWKWPKNWSRRSGRLSSDNPKLAEAPLRILAPSRRRADVRPALEALALNPALEHVPSPACRPYLPLVNQRV